MGKLDVAQPSNRSDPFDFPQTDLEVPRTKIERTISLRLIHTYGVVDPAGLRRLELGAARVERREEKTFGIRWRLDLQERREGSLGARQS